MTRFVPFWTDDGRNVTVNPDWVASVVAGNKMTTYLEMGYGTRAETVAVLGTFEDVVKKLESPTGTVSDKLYATRDGVKYEIDARRLDPS